MIETLLLDTNVASDLFKKRPRAGAYRPLLENNRLALSFMSVAELYKWTIKRNWKPSNIARLENTLRAYLIVTYDRDMAWSWGKVVAACEQVGQPISSSDAWIAATAIRHSLRLMTRNVRHFETPERVCGLRLLRVE
jgi:predicted nucleic acid-binding protein